MWICNQERKRLVLVNGDIGVREFCGYFRIVLYSERGHTEYEDEFVWLGDYPDLKSCLKVMAEILKFIRDNNQTVYIMPAEL